VEQALKMIVAYGGDQWCTDMIIRWAGKNEKGLNALKSDNALEVYGAFFNNEHTIRASNEDYKAGAGVDLDQQEEDQKNGRKINAPLLLIYSEHYIGSRYDLPKEWEDWVDKDVKVDSFAVQDGIGHFDAEEAPEECAREINNWLKGLQFGY
jgi:pimeloyl-ACP methyl ester carboxylesterase